MLELWTSEDCVKCKALKEYLVNNKIPFEEKVLDKDFNTGDLISETSKRNNPTMSFPVLINDNNCYTIKQIFTRSGQLNQVWLEEVL